MRAFFRYLADFLLSLVFYWYWSIPAWVLLILHFACGVPIFWFIAALVLWIVGVRVFMHIVGWLTYMGNKKEKENGNKNPYSVKKEKTDNDIR